MQGGAVRFCLFMWWLPYKPITGNVCGMGLDATATEILQNQRGGCTLLVFYPTQQIPDGLLLGFFFRCGCAMEKKKVLFFTTPFCGWAFGGNFNLLLFQQCVKICVGF